jgi:hypothetical protein
VGATLVVSNPVPVFPNVPNPPVPVFPVVDEAVDAPEEPAPVLPLFEATLAAWTLACASPNVMDVVTV